VARFYSNENFPLPVVLELRRMGHDVLTSMEAGNANKKIPDDQVLLFAIADKRAVLTLNRKDFIRLHWQNVSHCGIVVCTFDAAYERQAKRIFEEVAKISSLDSQLVRVNRGSAG
jgi:hypothetical protein